MSDFEHYDENVETLSENTAVQENEDASQGLDINLSTAVINEELEESSLSPQKKSKKPVAFIALIALLSVAVAAIWLGYMNFVFVGEIFGEYEIYRINVSAVDLSGSSIKDFSGLSRLKKLKEIDLSNTSFDDFTVLYKCRSLKKVDLGAKNVDADKCMEFYNELPDAQLICIISAGDKAYDSGITNLKISGLNGDELEDLAAFKHLKTLDLTQCTVDDEKYNYLKEKLPECDILRMVTFEGKQYRSDIESIELSSNISDAEIERLKYFSSLQSIYALECSDYDKLDKLNEKYPQCTIVRNVKILDVTAESTVEVLNLRGQKYSLDQFKAAFDSNLKNFSSLKKIDMCGCGLSNEEMEQLCEAYPDVKFVWYITFGRWKVRTDAVAFSTLNSNKEEEYMYNEKTFEPLFKYCTDLVALDLGHNMIKDISAIANLKKLRAIILTDNRITDISAFAELKDLEFIEMNASNRIQSVEPLKDLKILKYINIYSSKPATDLSSLYDHDNLKITIFHNSVPAAERKRFRESNPNCQTFFSVDIGPNPEHPITTNSAWRDNPYRKSIKKVFTNWRYVVDFDENNEFVFDWKTDQYKA